MVQLESVMNYYESKFQSEFNREMDEMKMHKLLYFTQKESYVLNDAPLFKEDFYGWRYGPVLHEVREYYKAGLQYLENYNLSPLTSAEQGLLDQVFKKYAEVNSWTLSLLSHDEYSWQQSRKGLSETERGDMRMTKDNIRKDALYAKVLRKRFGNKYVV